MKKIHTHTHTHIHKHTYSVGKKYNKNLQKIYTYFHV